MENMQAKYDYLEGLSRQMGSAPVEVRQNISGEVEKLEKLLAELEAALRELDSRLSPVMREPMPEANRKDSPIEVVSPLMSHLLRLERQTRQNLEIVHNIHQRLEL